MGYDNNGDDGDDDDYRACFCHHGNCDGVDDVDDDVGGDDADDEDDGGGSDNGDDGGKSYVQAFS